MQDHGWGKTTCHRFEDRVAVVTGAGQGIGLATAVRLASEGAKIAVVERHEHTATEAVRLLADMGATAAAFVTDVANQGTVSETAQKILDTFGSVDVLVNNAGFDRPGGFLKTSPEDFTAVWSVHVLGTVHCCMNFAPIMMRNGGGCIVNVSSIYGRVGSKGESAYSSAKAAIIGLTKSLAREWGARAIRVNAILPGLTDTPTIRDVMLDKFKDAVLGDTPLGRIADAAEIAAAIAFLASEDASFVTGATLEVTGGWNM
jgi:NAD(P)-dependent dehydrogenase (short-subunit alcohol dehydrogenase family)